MDSTLAAAECEQRAVNGEHVELAERAAITELAVRLASRSDLDHTVDLQLGGRTTFMNLSHLCRKHHRNKHMTRWSITRVTSLG